MQNKIIINDKLVYAFLALKLKKYQFWNSKFMRFAEKNINVATQIDA